MATKKYVKMLTVTGLDGEVILGCVLYTLDVSEGVLYADTEHGQHCFVIQNIQRWRVWDKIELKGRV